MTKERPKISKLADTLFVGHALIEDETGHRVVVCGDWVPVIDPKLSPEIAKEDVLKRVNFIHPGKKPLDITVYRCERIIGV